MRLLFTSLLISLLSVVTSANKKTQYKDFLLSDNAVWALTADGEISVIDLASKKVRRTIKNDVAVTHLAKDRTGAIVIVDKANQLKTYNKATGSWQPMQTIKHKMFGLVFDSQNRAYAVTDKGIQELATGEIYFSKLSRLDNQTMHEDRWEGLSCFHMDKDNNIWVGFDFGEWGGKLFIFDTGKKTFVKPTLDELDERLYPVQSFSEDSTFVYVSAAMSHMMTSGSISRFKNFQETLLFESKAHLSEPVKVGTGTEMYTIHGEGIQSLVCSSYDNAMYFASQNGIFRGEVPRGPIEAQHWQHIATNDVGAKKSSPKAVLVPHNINKIASLKKNTLVFLAQFDGIGILENGRVTMLN
jgi:ligand-binding sensor domain-containing protein